MELMIAEVDFYFLLATIRDFDRSLRIIRDRTASKKGGDSYARYQFAACYAIILITALMVANSSNFFIY